VIQKNSKKFLLLMKCLQIKINVIYMINMGKKELRTAAGEEVVISSPKCLVSEEAAGKEVLKKGNQYSMQSS